MPVVVSVAGSALIQFAFQTYWFFNIRKQDFYTEPEVSDSLQVKDMIESYEGTVLFLVSNFQYVVTALAFSLFDPYRRAMYFNLPFMFTTLGVIALNVFLLVSTSLNELMQLFDLPSGYLVRVGIGVMLNCLVTLGFEILFIRALS